MWIRWQFFASLCLVLFCRGFVAAGDWPTYMFDDARVGVTDEAAQPNSALLWSYQAPAAPRPAWPLPQVGWNELPKVNFDDASYAVADAERIYFGSTTENALFAVDAASGKISWKFYTSGAIRLAPTLAGGKIYFGADDGRVYCLHSADGTVAWTFNAARDTTVVLSNGQVASLWAVRTNVLVEAGRVYVGAGVFPYHEVAAYALDANTGAVIWKNAKIDSKGSFSAQGYLVGMKAGIVFFNGRALPSCLSRENGSVVFSVPSGSTKGRMGGDYGVAYNGVLYTGTQNALASTNEKGESVGKTADTARIMPAKDAVYTLRGPSAARIATTQNAITATTRAEFSPDGKATKRWTYTRPGLASMILAGGTVIAGADNSVVMIDAATGKEQWVGTVDGTAVGLAYAHGRLIVSTNKGHVFCFGAGVAAPAGATPRAASGESADAQRGALVKAIVQDARCGRGYALVLGRGAADFACELARQTSLQITCVESDPARLTETRSRVDAAGLYGHRVTVEVAGATGTLAFPDFAGNLVVQLDEEYPAAGLKELLRTIKPCGGALYSRASLETAQWQKLGVPTAGVGLAGQTWTRFVRGELPGSGWWTHQYADAGNSGSSGDTLIKGRLGVLWYGEPGGDEAPDRHTRGAAPLMFNGRVYAQGIRFPGKTYIYSYDAYNGVRYWQRDIPDAVRVGIPGVSGNLACNADSVFVATGAECYRIDAITGEVRTRYAVPGAASGATWGFLSVADNVLLGSASHEKRVTFSNAVFAYDLATDQLKWNHPTSEVRNTAIAVGSGRVFFAQDRSTTVLGKTSPAALSPFPDAVKPAAAPATQQVKKEVPKETPAKVVEVKKAEDEDHVDDDDAPGAEPSVDRLGKPVGAMPVMRNVVAIDVATGAKAWDRDVDLTHCGAWNSGTYYGATQALCKDDVLLFAGAYTGYGGGKVFASAPKNGVALSTRDGTVLWATTIDTLTRPIFMQNALLSEPVFFDVRSGKKLARSVAGKDREWNIGKTATTCGFLSASDSMVFGRSGVTVWKSVTDAAKASSFRGIRPGCLINIVPAGGVVVQAEASAGCTCTHSIQCTVVFKPE